MSAERLAIRYFRPEAESSTESGVRFAFEYDYTLASYEAIWDSVRGCRSRTFANFSDLNLDGLYTRHR